MLRASAVVAVLVVLLARTGAGADRASLRSLRSWMTGEWVDGGEEWRVTDSASCGGRCTLRTAQSWRRADDASFARFGSAPARACLASAGVNRIMLFGDSYMRRMHNSFADVLVGSHGPEDLGSNLDVPRQDDDGEPRRAMGGLTEMFRFTGVQGVTLEYHRLFNQDERLRLLEKEVAAQPGTLLLYGFVVHAHKFAYIDSLIQADAGLKPKRKKVLIKDKQHAGRRVFRKEAHSRWLQQLSYVARAAKKAKHFVFITSPAYDIALLEKVNKDAAIAQPNDRYLGYNIDGINRMGQLLDEDIPFLDAFHLTQSCKWENCSKDGAHRSKFVNRMKAHMILNHLCPEAERQKWWEPYFHQAKA
mmetsp:Transcript_31514/g.102667  ORF Transcript_31514/g.102667 Transcript_31514/m.102667 type:complete len:361 (+) Transcript_31514:114-1196(+)